MITVETENSANEFNSILDMTKGTKSELEGRSEEITQISAQRRANGKSKRD